MAKLCLRDTIDEIMGLDRCVFMTQYFSAGEADIFIIVNNDVDDSYYLLYDGDGKTNVFEIGSKIAFKRFIGRSYSVNPSINYSNDFWGNLPLEKHVEAKRRASLIIKDALARKNVT